MPIKRFIPTVLDGGARKDSHDEGRHEGADDNGHHYPHPQSEAKSICLESRRIAKDSLIHEQDGDFGRPGDKLVADLANVEVLQQSVRSTPKVRLEAFTKSACFRCGFEMSPMCLP